MDTLPLSIANGWASGISAYGVLFIAGVLGRVGYADTPEALQRTDVMIFVGVLLAIEFVADKIPYVDSIWDSVHTVIRPTVAAILGILIAGHASTLDQAVAASSSSITALLSHLAKGGFRLAVNTSPEPVTNIGTSFAEDGAVIGITVLAWQFPWVAASIALTLLVLGLLLSYFLLSRIKRGLARMRQRRA
ncbi:MAG TPA: DUF4126 domain-containing protein [Mycobacteriales bacterium]|jgi:hypothetical protein|nr:DUF4126 domain-containing protein [Mycobacteriales bacterium]